jgi:hypothetical protein
MKNTILKTITVLMVIIGCLILCFGRIEPLQIIALTISLGWCFLFMVVNAERVNEWCFRNCREILICMLFVLLAVVMNREEINAEPTPEVEVEVEYIEEVKLYNVPLSEELQKHIIAECEKHNIAPSVVIAIIERESRYDAQAIGDSGKSIGLMQIQKHFHLDRMSRLGCDDLLDPFQNVTVGIDYLAELKDINDDLYWVLMVYNGGFDYANTRMETENYSDYAIAVSERISELEKEVE